MIWRFFFYFSLKFCQFSKRWFHEKSLDFENKTEIGWTFVRTQFWILLIHEKVLLECKQSFTNKSLLFFYKNNIENVFHFTTKSHFLKDTIFEQSKCVQLVNSSDTFNHLKNLIVPLAIRSDIITQTFEKTNTLP